MRLCGDAVHFKESESDTVIKMQQRGKKQEYKRAKLLMKWTCRVSEYFKLIKCLILRWIILPVCTLIGKLKDYFKECFVLFLTVGCNKATTLLNNGIFCTFQRAHIARFGCAVVVCAVILCLSTTHSQQGITAMKQDIVVRLGSMATFNPQLLLYNVESVA